MKQVVMDEFRFDGATLSTGLSVNHNTHCTNWAKHCRGHSNAVKAFMSKTQFHFT